MNRRAFFAAIAGAIAGKKLLAVQAAPARVHNFHGQLSVDSLRQALVYMKREYGAGHGDGGKPEIPGNDS